MFSLEARNKQEKEFAPEVDYKYWGLLKVEGIDPEDVAWTENTHQHLRVS